MDDLGGAEVRLIS